MSEARQTEGDVTAAEMAPETPLRDDNGRVALDDYPTPPLLCAAICSVLKGLLPAPRRIIEPSAGAGNFLIAARATWPESRLVAVEVQEQYRNQLAAVADCVLTSDWESTAPEIARRGGVELILGNPPYGLAEEHIVAALAALAPNGILALLLRLNFLCSYGRAVGLWRQHPPSDIWPIAQRPGFRLNKKGKKSTDMTEYGLFLWSTDAAVSPCRLHASEAIVWREPGRSR